MANGVDETAARGAGPQLDITLPPSIDGSSFTTWCGFNAWIARTDLVEADDLASFSAHVQTYPFSDLMFSHMDVSRALRYVRTAQDVARSGVHHVLIYLHIAGRFEGTCAGKRFAAGPGDISFIDLGQPFDHTVSPMRAVSLMVPRSMLSKELSGRAIHGLVPPRAAPATRLMAGHMRAFIDTVAALAPAEAHAGARAILDLADGAVHASRPLAAATSEPADLALFDEARRYIERHIARQDLSVDAIAKVLKVPRKKLFRLFADYGGVTAYMRERRLDLCYGIINENYRPNDTLGNIAFSVGIASEAVFSRSFKERFGVSPRALRTVARERSVDARALPTGSMPPRYLATLGE